MLAAEPDFSALHKVLAQHERVALAVSGGADSVALMLAAADWAKAHKRLNDIYVVSVDHNLRDNSQNEANTVYGDAISMGLNASVLTWQHDGIASNLQEQARKARYELMAQFCRAHNIKAVLTAHHKDDQVETLLMRLAHGSGLDGLVGMRDDVQVFGVRVLRPLLDIKRDALRQFVRSQKANWVDDPSNSNQAFERVRVRDGIKALERAEMSLEGLPLSAKRLARAQIALENETDRLMQSAVEVFQTGYAQIDRVKFENASAEISIRLLKRLVVWASGGNSPVQLSEIERAFDGLMAGQDIKMTLSGSVIAPRQKTILIGREFGRMEKAVVQSNGVWDGRFVVETGHNVEPYGNLIDGDFRLRPQDLPHFAACCLPVIRKVGDKFIVPHLDMAENGVEECPISLANLPKGYVNHA